jgi:hypothetical protein
MTNYTKQDYERDIKILEGAPDSDWPVADEYGVLDGEAVYISNSDNGHPFKVLCDCDGEMLWCYAEDDADFLYIRDRRKLSYIRALVRMYEQLQDAKTALEEAVGWNWLDGDVPRQIQKKVDDVIDSLTEQL